MYLFALLMFIVAGISDGLDGLIARYFNQHTVLGAYLDPIADKMLLMSAYVSLALLQIIPEWLTVIVISRDLLIVIGIVVFKLNDISFAIKPTIDSKWNTVAQLATVCLALLGTEFFEAGLFMTILFWFTAAITVYSGLHYIYIGLNIVQSSANNKPGI